MQVKISDSIKYIGVDDKTIDLFESQYLVPNGISYNSYLIVDEKVAIMDTVDKRKTNEWLENLDRELNGRTPDYLVISHIEPDHASNIKVVSEKYPSMKLVGNAKTFSMLPQFFPDFDFADKTVTVKEGDELELGSHKLTFIMAPAAIRLPTPTSTTLTTSAFSKSSRSTTCATSATTAATTPWTPATRSRSI